MDLSFLLILLHALFMIVPVMAAPRFNIQQVKRNLDKIWKDMGGETGKNKGKREIKKRTEIDVKNLYHSGSYSSCMKIRLKPGKFCKFLTVVDGAVRATNENFGEENEEGVFQIESYGSSVKKLKYVPTNEYIIMNSHGRISTTKDKNNDESLFINIQEEKTFLVTFASVKYYMEDDNYDLFLGIRKKNKNFCKTVNARRTIASSKSNQFLQIPIDQGPCT